MSETKKLTAIELLTNTLGEMTARAAAAEAEVEKLKNDDSNWYSHWQTKDAEVKRLTVELEKTKDDLHCAMVEINKNKEGGQQNERSNDTAGQ